ncbi:MAG: restriction endonuclease [Bacillota bacterium]|nr:restriction endonuclease [Bacillota bacterium]
MNNWTQNSFNLYNSPNYLDMLHEIYPMLDNDTRELSSSIKKQLETYYADRNNEELFKLLLEQEKFPVKDSYKAYFGRVKKSELDIIIKNNPETINRICNRIYKDGYEKMIERITEPKETNRQIGPMFTNWLKSAYPSYTDPNEFLNSKEQVSVYSASDAALVQLATNYLGCKLPVGTDSKEKGLDLVVKVNNKGKIFFIIGEAKFLTDFGGHQNAQLNDALNLILFGSFQHKQNLNILRIAVLDGVCWIDTSNDKMVNRLRMLPDDNIALSALLLNDFFYSLS